MIELPSSIRDILDKALAKVKLGDLEKAFANLSYAYKSGEKKTKHLIGSEQERLLYLATRLPATYATLCHVLDYFQRIVTSLPSCTLLDIGAGPGTFLMACWRANLSLQRATLVEKDHGWNAWGKQLLGSLYPSLPIDWRFEDIEKGTLLSHDLVVMSYSLGELRPDVQKKVVENCWSLTSRYLFLIEPGTPAGFNRIREAREFLLQQGAHMVAPCPHAFACPMPKEDWCHFSARLPRTSLHRRIKGGDLGYEDEKFSYVIFSKEPCPLPAARIIRHPQINQGHIRFQLCHEGKLEQKVFSKKQGELYRWARHQEWGDSLAPDVILSKNAATDDSPDADY